MSNSGERSAVRPVASIVILTYNGKEHIEHCLTSLTFQAFEDYEIIVVDNASSDGTPEFIKELIERLSLKKVRIVENPVNVGYCGGNNIGVRHSSGKYIVILNQDTWVEPHWLEALVRDAEASDAAILQSKILYPDGMIRTAGNFLDIYGMFLCRGRFEEDHGQYDRKPYDFFYASGASILVKRELFKEIGGFDEGLFMYGEDEDLSWRARLRGYRIKMVPGSICYHKGGEAFAIDPKKFYLFCRNRIRVLLKNYSTKNALTRVPIAILLIVLSALFFSFWRRDVGFLYQAAKAIGWNIKNLKETFNLRNSVQSQRRVKDRVIEKYLSHSSFEFTHYPLEVARKIHRAKL